MANSAKGGAKSFEFWFKLDGVFADPDTITFEIEYPDGTTATATDGDMEAVATGKYRYTHAPLSQSGIHTYRVSATWSGVTQKTLDKTFVVDETAF